MSLETWKAEFYPIEAIFTAESDAIAHSLKKWEGLMPENLEAHGLEVTFGGNLYEMDDDLASPVFSIGSASCALCEHFYVDDVDSEGDEHRCGECPLYKVRGAACDNYTTQEENNDGKSPWLKWTDDRNPQPMIFWLKAALDQHGTPNT